MDVPVEIVTPIISGLIAWGAAHLRLRSQNRLDDATAQEKISAAWEKLNEPLLERIEALEEDLKERDALIADLQSWIEQLVTQITELGHEPVAFVANKSKMLVSIRYKHERQIN